MRFLIIMMFFMMGCASKGVLTEVNSAPDVCQGNPMVVNGMACAQYLPQFKMGINCLDLDTKVFTHAVIFAADERVQVGKCRYRLTREGKTVGELPSLDKP